MVVNKFICSDKRKPRSIPNIKYVILSLLLTLNRNLSSNVENPVKLQKIREILNCKKGAKHLLENQKHVLPYPCCITILCLQRQFSCNYIIILFSLKVIQKFRVSIIKSVSYKTSQLLISLLNKISFSNFVRGKNMSF